MASKGISLATNLVQSPVLRPAGDAFSPDALTGRLELVGTTVGTGWVSPGTGRLVLAEREGKEVVAQGAARRNGQPVLPGTGLKGAVRALFELLTDSCDHFQKSCGRCPACALFGYLGQMGRASFTDAVPAEPGAVAVGLERVPEAWEPHPEKTLGEFRVYDRASATARDPVTKKTVAAPRPLWREVFRGRFRTTLSFENASRDELGRLLVTLGLGSSLHVLRLGGHRFDGQGAFAVAPGSMTLWTPRRRALPQTEILEKPATAAWCARLVTEAEASPWGRAVESTLVRLGGILGEKERTP